MTTLKEEHKKIGAALFQSPKTAEELQKQLGIPYDQLNESLKEMLNLKLIEKSGFPTKYQLNKEIYEKIMKRKEIAKDDKNKLRLRIIIEAQSPLQEILEKELKRIEEVLRNEPDFTIYDCVLEKIVQVGEHFASFLEVDLSVRDFRALAKLLFFYGPSSIEIIKPSKLELNADELQDGLMIMANMIQAYNHYIIKKMTAEEIEAFNRRIFGQK